MTWLYFVVGVYLNQVVCSPLVPLHSKTLACGQLARLSVKLQNNSSAIFPVSHLVLEPYWFSNEMRKIIKDPTGKMLHSNTLVTRVPKASCWVGGCGSPPHTASQHFYLPSAQLAIPRKKWCQPVIGKGS